MARGGNGGGGKGGKGGGGKGRGPTQRSRDYLARYGYPSSRELRREAEGLAGASVSSVRATERPFQRQAQSAKDFLAAVQSALAETQGQVGAGYDQATASQSALDAATQSRLAGLGLGVDAAGVQAASGARSDSATANLLSNEASAKAYSAAQPGIAAGATGVTLAGLRKQQTDALAARRESLRNSFFQALQQVQSNALARAGFNQSADQFQQNMHLQQAQFGAQQAAQATSTAQADRSFAEQVREFNISRKDAKRAQTAAGISPSEFRQEAALAQGIIGAPAATTRSVPTYKTGADGKQHLTGYKQVTVQGTDTRDIAQKGVHYRDALQQLLSAGVQPQIAQLLLSGLYEKYANAPPDAPSFRAYVSYVHYFHPNQIAHAERTNTGLTGPH